MSTNKEITIPLLLLRLPERPTNSESVWRSQGSASPEPATKLQKVRPCSVGAVPTSGRAARPVLRKKTNNPVISTSNATHSRRSSLCSTWIGARVRCNTNEINAVLVETAEEIKIAPKTLLRDQSGILVAVSSTPV